MHDGLLMLAFGAVAKEGEARSSTEIRTRRSPRVALRFDIGGDELARRQ